MRTTAELAGERLVLGAHGNDADDVAILLAKQATAPAALASSMPMTRVTTGLDAKICWLTRSSTALSCSEDRASKCVKSKRRCSGVTSEPA